MPPQTDATVPEVVLTEGEPPVTVNATPVGSDGKPRPFDGTPTWSAEPADLVTLTPDGWKCQLAAAAGQEGQATIRLDAPSNRDPNKHLSGTLAVRVQAGEATEVVITPEQPPTPEPAPQPPAPSA